MRIGSGPLDKQMHVVRHEAVREQRKPLGLTDAQKLRKRKADHVGLEKVTGASIGAERQEISTWADVSIAWQERGTIRSHPAATAKAMPTTPPSGPKGPHYNQIVTDGLQIRIAAHLVRN